MSEKKKDACPGAATLEQATEPGVNSYENPVSNSDSTTAAEVGQWEIADILPTGEANAIPLRHLTAMTGLHSRELRRRIEKERRQGAAICSNNRTGYYLAENTQERRWFANSMKHCAREILLTAWAIEEAFGSE